MPRSVVIAYKLACMKEQIWNSRRKQERLFPVKTNLVISVSGTYNSKMNPNLVGNYSSIDSNKKFLKKSTTPTQMLERR